MIPFFVGLFLLFVGIAAVIVTLREVSLWIRDNRSPIQTIEAKVVVTFAESQRNDGPPAFRNVCGFYIATFALYSGEQIDFIVSKSQYETLKWGDKGTLTFQGTRFNKFATESAGNGRGGAVKKDTHLSRRTRRVREDARTGSRADKRRGLKQ